MEGKNTKRMRIHALTLRMIIGILIQIRICYSGQAGYEALFRSHHKKR